ncbi:hypothetical protein EQM14_07125 [Caproiciproducens sp. NJN-50]|uniref:YdeI/OmpD-associated family protein n=1 Tax=Acutalibacteraceae TaxID=3082771 RepID=UPI000FFE0166|nr:MULTISPECIES: YdeI/OmpD-associated family protein [Acutalibacteraceae]QAT49567.1 hypothetical protein EQM14_07125 [Caproiciproducens sp. NJN-50]
MGENKTGADMPIGLMMSLARHQNAMKNFALLGDEGQKSVIQYVQDSVTGEEAKSRIQNAVRNLEQGNSGFLG